MKKLSPYKFCPVCGGKLVKKRVGLENNERKVCKDCDYVFYMTSTPTVNAVILNDKNELLLTKRGIPPAIGKWDFAGGFLEHREDPIKGLKREIMEELGVDCKVGDFVDVQLGYFPAIFRRCTFNMYYYATLKKGKIIPMSDVAAVKWFPLNKIKESQMSYKGGWNIVKKIRKNV